MKKRWIVPLTASLLLLLCSCASNSAPDHPVPATSTPVPIVELEPEAVPIPEENQYRDIYALEALMTEFSGIQAGSAGCSLRAVGCAAKLMDWGVSTSMTEEEIYSAVAAHFSSMNESDAALYREQLRLLDSTYLQLLAPDQEELLESAGCTDTGYPWGSEPIWAVEQFMSATEIRQLSPLSLSSANMEDLYSDYLYYSHRVLLEGESADTGIVPVNRTVLMEYRATDGLHKLGYCLYDINRDGLEELILGSVEDPTQVYDIVSLINGQVTPVFQGWVRNAGQVCTDGTILVCGSGGAAYTSYGFYSLQDGQFLLTAGILYDANTNPQSPWSYTTDPAHDPANTVLITEEQALGYIRQYESTAIAFDFFPFAVMGLHP